ncbi:MAG: DUF2855 family protein [Sphingomonadaceae bacterium]
MQGYVIETEKAALDRHQLVETGFSPGPGEVTAALDLAAVTANNVTYAVHHGPPLHYGAFFPATDRERLVVPLWGFATITASRAPGVREGDRFYGYWPSASHLLLRPGDPRESGFADTAPHRQPMAAVYNQYVAAASLAPNQEDEPFASLFRPLFGTAFALDDALGGGAERLVFTSASSKTALGTAWCLQQRGGREVIGLTSAANKAFVAQTGLYAEVLAYEALEELDPQRPTTLVDFAGNGAVKARLHRHLAALKASHIVGDTHWSEPPAGDLPGPAPALFFAPSVIAAMIARDGPSAFHRALAEAMAGFADHAARWLTIVDHAGPDGFAAAFDPLVAGRAAPETGAIWRP